MIGHQDNSLSSFPRWGSLFALLCLLAGGCSSGRYTTMYLNQLVNERAEQEVKLETMALDLEAAQNTIMTLEMENKRLREQAGLDADTKPIRERRIGQEPEEIPAIDSKPKSESRKKAAETTDDDLSGAPELDITPIEEEASSPPVDAKTASAKRADEDDSAADSFLPTHSNKENSEPSPAEAAEEDLPNPNQENGESESAKAGAAVSLTIDKHQTRGEDLDGAPGDEGVLVVLQPRDASGKYLERTGAVVIEIVDSPTASKADPSAQAAEWKFSPEEVRRATRNSALGRGAYLSVDWDEHRPLHEKLLVIARWKLPDGQELTAEQVVRVNVQKGQQAWDSPLDRSGDAPSASIATRPTTNAPEAKSWAPSRR